MFIEEIHMNISIIYTASVTVLAVRILFRLHYYT